MRPIGHYVHHQGAGHLHRALAIRARMARPATLLGTGIARVAPPLLDLPDDRMASDFAGCDGEEDRPECFHYAPLGHRGVQARMAMLARWMQETDPVLVVVDVSVEVALLARLLAVPTLVVRLAGDRTDMPHLEAFRSAHRLLAPFPEDLEAAGTPAWIRRKTIYAGLLARRDPAPVEGDGRIVVLLGRGGDGPAWRDVAEAARAVPDREWHVLGAVEATGPAVPNLHHHGWVEDVAAQLGRAAVVVGGGGDGVVAAVAAAGRRFVCLPEPRPFREQAVKAEALARLGAAVTRERWPTARDWPGLLREAERLDPARLAGLVRDDAIGALARTIERIAEGLERGRPSEDPV